MPRLTSLRQIFFAPVAAVLVATATFPTSVHAQLDLESLQDEAVAWLQEYIGINTINPPGNETAGAEFFARIFEAEGIEYEMAESAPGRGNIWA